MPCTSDGEQFIGVFMLAQIINGLGYCTMFTLGSVYFYENSNPNTAALYVGMGIFYFLLPVFTYSKAFHYFGHNVRKRTFGHVRPAKIQFSKRIRAV